jgi:hypothetical protein
VPKEILRELIFKINIEKMNEESQPVTFSDKLRLSIGVPMESTPATTTSVRLDNQLAELRDDT